MDALEMLKDDHNEMQARLTKLAHLEGVPARNVFVEVNDILKLHEELEETFIYSELRQQDLTHDIVLEGLEEHRLVDSLVEQIEALKPDEEAWKPKVKVFTENLEHHLEEEERELFPKVRMIWNRERLQDIAKKMRSHRAARVKEMQLGVRQNAT